MAKGKQEHPKNSLSWLAEKLGVSSTEVWRAVRKVARDAPYEWQGRYKIYEPEAIAAIEAEVLRPKLPKPRQRGDAGLFVPSHGKARPCKVLISLTQDQHTAAQKAAAEKGVTVTELVTEIVLESWLF